MANVEHASLTGASLHEPKGVAAASQGQVYVADGSGSGAWTSLTSTTPVGAVTDFAGATAPSGWLLCYGQAISRTTYSELFAAIGTTYGAGNGSTTYNLPDLRGMVTAGKDNMGGSTRGALTSSTISGGATTLGNSAVSEGVTLTRANLPNDTIAISGSVSTSVTGTFGATPMVGLLSGFTTVGIRDGGAIIDGCPQSTDIQELAATSVFTGNSIALNGGVTQSQFSKVQPTIILNKIIFANA